MTRISFVKEMRIVKLKFMVTESVTAAKIK
jgi:hypothetical protein